MNETYEIWYYRTSQAYGLIQAEREGSVRKHTLDGPAKSLLDGCAADAVALIAQATDMMEHEARIAYNLMVNGVVVDKKVFPS